MPPLCKHDGDSEIKPRGVIIDTIILQKREMSLVSTLSAASSEEEGAEALSSLSCSSVCEQEGAEEEVTPSLVWVRDEL